MADPFLGELRLFSFEQAPVGWAQCNGQFLPINQNQALFSLFGTMYGGNGQTTFQLPDLRGRCAMHVGGSHNVQGEAAGSEAVTISISQMPTHIHFFNASTVDGTQPVAASALLGAFNNGYTAPAALQTIAPETIANVGGSQAHQNRSPFLTLNFCVALIGIFPSRN